MSGEPAASAGHDAGRAPDSGPALFLDQGFDAGTLYQLRSALAAHTAELGVPASQADDILIAVHELASNAVRHGEGFGRLRAWTDQRTLICTVTDGDAPGDLTPPAAVREPPAVSDELPWPILPGHGLWLVTKVADRLVVSSEGGPVSASVCFTTVRSPA